MKKYQVIELLTRKLGLGQMLEEPVRVHGGLLHNMYHVKTMAGEYAGKRLNPEIMKRPEALTNIKNSEKIAKAFEAAIPLVCAITFEGKQIQCLDKDYYLVFPWINAVSVFGQDITFEHCRVMGEILGKIHYSKRQVEGVLPEADPFEMFEWEYYLQRVRSFPDEKQWIMEYKNAVSDIKNWNKEACRSHVYLSGNQVISHRDLDPKNVIWDEYKPYVIDWESAGYVNPFQELLEVIHYWCGDGNGALDEKKIAVLAGAYSKYADMAGVDWNAVFSGSYMGMLGWLSYNIRRALGIEGSDQDEMGSGEEQVIGTIRELYSFQKNAGQIKKVIGCE